MVMVVIKTYDAMGLELDFAGSDRDLMRSCEHAGILEVMAFLQGTL